MSLHSADSVIPSSEGLATIAGRKAGMPSPGRSSRQRLLFVVSALSFAYMPVPALGRIYLSEVLLALYFFHCLAQRRRLSQWVRGMLLLASLWLLCQIGSDIYNQVALRQTIRAGANILALALDLSALSFLLEREGSLRAAGLTIAIGLVLAGLGEILLQPDVYTQVDPWKFGMAFPVTLLVAAISLRLRRAASGSMLLLSSVNFALGYRSLAAICLLSGAIALVAQGAPLPEPARHHGKPRMKALAVVIACALATLAATHVYDFAVDHGWLGKAAAEKYAYQAHGRYGVLGGGRSDIYFSSIAVQRRPVIGYGSEPRMTAELAMQGLGNMYTDGYRLPSFVVDNILESPTIPTHSFIMGAWVQAGIGGLLFWVSMVVVIFNILMRLLKQGMLTNGFIGVSLASAIWNVLFSPLSGPSRLSFAVTFALLAWTATLSQGDREPTRQGVSLE
jgi:hypothetical protein